MQIIPNTIVCGDCIEILENAEKPFADLIFADPPFNIGYKYDKYKDSKKDKHYIEWTEEWMSACVGVLKAHGSFYIAIGDEYAANVKVIADKLGLILRNWIIWHYTFGQQAKNKYARAHTHIFYFVKDKAKFIFNDNAVRVPSDRQLIYNDTRSNSVGKLPNDVWDNFSRVCGTFKERVGWHPCQMPQMLLARIIFASSNPKDIVLDPFNGSGTTAAAALLSNRNYIGIDISQDYCDRTQERLNKLKKQIDTEYFKLDFEVKRLQIDMATEPNEILNDEKTLSFFVNQLKIRCPDLTDISENKVKTSLAALTEFRKKDIEF